MTTFKYTDNDALDINLDERPAELTLMAWPDAVTISIGSSPIVAVPADVVLDLLTFFVDNQALIFGKDAR